MGGSKAQMMVGSEECWTLTRVQLSQESRLFEESSVIIVSQLRSPRVCSHLIWLLAVFVMFQVNAIRRGT